jgi:prophage regulatory protein
LAALFCVVKIAVNSRHGAAVRPDTKPGEPIYRQTSKHWGIQKKDDPMHQSEPRRMLSEKQVLQLVPVSRSTLLRMEKAGRFPRSTYISPNRRIWFEDEIVGWQNAVDEFNPNRGRGKGRRRA